MKLEGIHHVTAITGDAPSNVEFYGRVLGLRLVKKTVNQDDPTVYHLFYADEKGSAGADITFFEYPGATRGRAGPGMVHLVQFRVASEGSLDLWERRLQSNADNVVRSNGSLRFTDPEGLDLELVVDGSQDEALVSEHPEIPAGDAIRGFDGVRAFSADPDASRQLFEDGLGFAPTSASSWVVRGSKRGGTFAFDPPPQVEALGGAGTVHHVAWACEMDEHEAWRRQLLDHRVPVTPVIDRFYFRSIYFREPSGVLFEIATLGPGFTADEDLSTLGMALSLPPNYEHLRNKLAQILTPLPDPRADVS